jgi:hypothetical protein
VSYLFMKPTKKRRHIFRDEEYENATSIEDAYWMARQETKLIPWLP